MAKSKVGGTRAYIRGRIGSDVYSIGKNASGQKQQVVRSLAEQVRNPQTLAQMRGRMIMSTVMQAVAAMSVIIDHSFDSLPAGQPNISEFIKLNYALIKADVAAHPSSGNSFGLNKYQEKGIKVGAYQVSRGNGAGLNSGVVTVGGLGIQITVGTGKTIADLRTILGIGAEDYFTFVALNASSGFKFLRCHIDQSLADTTVIDATSAPNVFLFEGNVDAEATFDGGNIEISAAIGMEDAPAIVSRKQDGSYIHNTVKFTVSGDPSWPASTALATYPEGTQRFLNGGDENFNSSQSVTPTSDTNPTPTPSETPTLTLTVGSGVTSITATVDGNAVTSGSTVEAGKTVNVAVVAADAEKVIDGLLNGSAISLTQSGANWSGSFTMPSANATFVAKEHEGEDGDQN